MAEYITREAAIELLHYNADETCSAVVSDFEALPAVDIGPSVSQFRRMAAQMDYAPVMHGRWIPVYESEMTGWNPAVAGCDPIGGYICAACKEEAVYDCNDKFVLSNYCPWCGAKMDGNDGG